MLEGSGSNSEPGHHAPSHHINGRPSPQGLRGVTAKAAFCNQAPHGYELLGVHAQKMRWTNVLLQVPTDQGQSKACRWSVATQHETAEGVQDEGEHQAHDDAPS